MKKCFVLASIFLLFTSCISLQDRRRKLSLERVFFPLLVCVFTLFAGMGAFAQELVVVVAPFENKAGFSRDTVGAIEKLFVIELKKTNAIKVVDQSEAMFKEIIKRMKFELLDWSDPVKVAEFGKALNANAVVLGETLMLGDQRIITARINDLKTEIHAANHMVVKNENEILDKLPTFTKEIVKQLPQPPLTNPFQGRWRSTITSNGLTLICILNFSDDGQIRVEQYDTNKVTRHLGGLSYSNNYKKGRGSGSYSFRESGSRVIVDISLTITGVASEFTAVTAQGIFSARTPNQFEIDSNRVGENVMKCEYHDGGISDWFKIFNKL